jgi:lysozyme family protein
MISNLSATLAYIDADEGPELNVSPDEPGGSSCRGVTMEVLQEYNKAHGKPAPSIDDMKAMTALLAGQIFTWRYLDALRFNDLPSGVDYRLADAAISLGETGACVVVQLALCQWPVTGIMDAATIAAIKADNPKELLRALDAAWLTWKMKLKPDGWAKYGHGWSNRVKKVRARVAPMLGTS